MKKKYLTKTYLRDVSKHEVKMYLDQDDCYIIIKKLIQVDIPFIKENDIILMDNGYYILEVVPKYENYAMRLFLNDKKEPIEYYFDICKNNRLDNETFVPCFDDLYLDIIFLASSENIRYLDKDELDYALETKDITKEDYELTLNVGEKLFNELKNHKNKFVNRDYTKYFF